VLATVQALLTDEKKYESKVKKVVEEGLVSKRKIYTAFFLTFS